MMLWLLAGKVPQKNLFFKSCLVLLMAGSFIFFSSCSSHKADKKYRIGISQCTTHDIWRQDMLKEMNREASFHPELELIIKNANLNPKKQVEQIQELLDEKVDLLIASPAEAEPIAPIINKAYQQGVPVILVDRNTLSKNYSAFIGANNYKVGLVAGAYTNALLKGEGRVMEIAGPDKGSSADMGRHNGFKDYLSQHSNIQYAKKLSLDWDDAPGPAEKLLTEELAKDHDVQVIFAQNDRLAFVAYKTCKKLGFEKNVFIIGVDGLPGENGGIDLVEKGFLKATILYPTGGKEAIQTAVNILNKKPFAKENELTSTIIDSTNVTIMKMQNQKVMAQQEDIDRRQKIIDEQILITRNQTNIILAISVTLALALIFGAIISYYLQENRKINKKLEVQKEEISNQRNQLADLFAQLKEATNARFNFFTNISHELRTPLTLILGPLEDTLSSPRLHFTLKNNLEFIQRNSMRLLRLINQLMDFRKMEEGKMKILATENNIGAFVTEIASAFNDLARKKAISFKVINKSGNLKVWFDVTMLDKVLFNLFSNAFKFTAQEGTINVIVDETEDGKNARIKVEDSGMGMTPEDVKQAFEVFYQGHSSRFKGSGLGLSLSKEFITLHHGDILIKSEKGRGTTFEVLLPRGNAHFSPQQILSEEPTVTNNYEEVKVYTNSIATPMEFQDEAKRVKENAHSILIIEDHDDLRQFLKSRLGEHFEITDVNNAESGMAAAFDTIPDLVIADIILPGQDGMQLTETLKQDIRTSHIPIILLTAKGSIEEQIQGFRSKADAYIVKPFNLEFLEETIKSLLKNRAVLREHYTSELPTEIRSNASNKLDRKFINEFTSLVEHNISNEAFSIDDICREMGISRVQLYRKVKALIGYNVNDYILTVRLQKAKYLLSNEDLNISEVSYKVGFSSQQYFSTVFKLKFGNTPSEFKAKKKVDYS